MLALLQSIGTNYHFTVNNESGTSKNYIVFRKFGLKSFFKYDNFLV